MLAAIKSAFRTKSGKLNLLLMALCIGVLLLFSYIDIGKATYVVFMIPACGVAFFGDRFVKIATFYMEQEVNKESGKK